MYLSRVFCRSAASRSYGTTAVCCQKPKVMKMAKVLNKFVAVDRRKKKWYEDHGYRTVMPSASKVTDTKHEHARTSNRRIVTLNKLFARHISDQMTTGEISEMLQGMDIKISKMSITSNFGIVNIFWYSEDMSAMQELETTLSRVAGILHHELSQLKVIGCVPKIYFVKDRKQLALKELDSMLAVADYGEDFKPSNYMSKLKSDFISAAPLAPNILEQVKQLEMSEELEETPIPPISQNVFGLDRQKILDRIIVAKTKSSEAWKRSEMNLQSMTRLSEAYKEQNDASEPLEEHKRINFNQFLRKREVLHRKLRKLAREAVSANTIMEQNMDEAAEEYNEEVDYEEDAFVYEENDDGFEITGFEKKS